MDEQIEKREIRGFRAVDIWFGSVPRVVSVSVFFASDRDDFRLD